MMRKLFGCLIAVMAMLSALPVSLSAQNVGDTVNVEGLRFEITSANTIKAVGVVDALEDSVLIKDWYWVKASSSVQYIVTSIADKAFAGLKKLKDFNLIVSHVIEMGDSVFKDCSALRTVTFMYGIPKQKNDSTLFVGAFSKLSVNIDGVCYHHSGTWYDDDSFTVGNGKNGSGYNSKTFGNEANKTKSVTFVKEVDGINVTEVTDYAFWTSNGPCRIYIPPTITTIGSRAFASSGNLSQLVVVDKDGNETASDYFKSRNGVLYDKTGTTLLCYPTNKSDVFYVPDGVKTIGEWSFNGVMSTSEVYLSESVTTISNDAFHGMTTLTNIQIGKNVTTIGANAFDGAGTKTNNLSVWFVNPSKFQTIDVAAFVNSGLKSIELPNSLVTIAKDAFRHCLSLKEITIPSSVTTIGPSAFEDCEELEKVTFETPSNLKSISYRTFRNNISLTEITIPEGVETVAREAFSGCDMLKTIELPSTLVTIADDALPADAGTEMVLSRQLNIAFDKGYSWATYFSVEDLTVPVGLKAYAVTGIDKNKSTLKTAEIGFLPKDKAVLLKLTDEYATSFIGKTFTKKPSLGNVTPDETLFRGSNKGIANFKAIEGDKYVLYRDDFVKCDSGKLAPYRCYVVLPVEESNASRLRIEKEEERTLNTFVILEEGVRNPVAGTAKLDSIAGGMLQLTVTPDPRFYANEQNISVLKSVIADMAKARGAMPVVDVDTIKVTPVDPNGDPSGTTKYTFKAVEGYEYEIIIDFQRRVSLGVKENNPKVNIQTGTDYLYDGTARKPKVNSVTYTVGSVTKTVDPANYDVTYENNVDAGVAKVLVTGKRKFTGQTHAEFLIGQRDISNITISAIPAQVFSGDAIVPKVTITDGNPSIIKASDYSIQCLDNVNAGTATLSVISNKINYQGIKSVTFTINPKDISKTAKVTIADQVYTGMEIEPTFTVIDDKRTVEPEYYTTAFADNVNLGEAKVTLQFNTNYKGTATRTFKIVPYKVDDKWPARISVKGLPAKVVDQTKPNLDGVSVTYMGRTLAKGTDYTVDYDAKGAKFTITFKCSFITGQIVIPVQVVVGIDAADADEAAGEWYGLNGQKLSGAPQRNGFYVKRGKGARKIVVR